jgi:uncharacterized membrane protein (GlpM family)
MCPNTLNARLTVHAAAVVGLGVVLAVVWATTSRGVFWPIQAMLPLAVTVAIHGWIVVLAERPHIRERFLDSEALAIHFVVAASLWLYLVALWAERNRGYVWPAWALLGLAALVGVHAMRIAGRRETRDQMRAGG